MKTIKYFKIAAIAILMLGIIHICATPVILKMFRVLEFDKLIAFAYMFIVTGLAFVFIGWLQLFILKRLQDDPSYLTILKASVIFITIGGVDAVAALWYNPFAYISLFVALCEIYILKRLTREIAN